MPSTTPQAAWIGVSDAELIVLRRAFRVQLAEAMARAFPAARVTWRDYGMRLRVHTPGRAPVELWEPNHFWQLESEDERIARAVAYVAAAQGGGS